MCQRWAFLFFSFFLTTHDNLAGHGRTARPKLTDEKGAGSSGDTWRGVMELETARTLSLSLSHSLRGVADGAEK